MMWLNVYVKILSRLKSVLSSSKVIIVMWTKRMTTTALLNRRQKREIRERKGALLSPCFPCVFFDQLLERLDGMRSHLAANAPILHNKDFENVVVKIQSGKEPSLTRNEKNAMRVFLLDDGMAEERRRKRWNPHCGWSNWRRRRQRQSR